MPTWRTENSHRYPSVRSASLRGGSVDRSRSSAACSPSMSESNDSCSAWRDAAEPSGERSVTTAIPPVIVAVGQHLIQPHPGGALPTGQVIVQRPRRPSGAEAPHPTNVHAGLPSDPGVDDTPPKPHNGRDE